jgi:hypothetical protein
VGVGRRRGGRGEIAGGGRGTWRALEAASMGALFSATFRPLLLLRMCRSADIAQARVAGDHGRRCHMPRRWRGASKACRESYAYWRALGA